VPCPVCTHPDRALIETRLLQGETVRAIGNNYDDFSYGAVQKHKQCMKRPVEPRPPIKYPVRPTPGLSTEEVVELDRFPLYATPLDQSRWMLNFATKELEELKKKGEISLVQKGIQNLIKQIELNARLLGEYKERIEVSGPGGGPIQLQAMVATLPLQVQELVPRAEAGDNKAQRALDRYTATGAETLPEQILVLRQMLAEAEEEAQPLLVEALSVEEVQ
jgi:hypothetical protein